MLVSLSKYTPSISRATATKMNRDESNHGVIQGETLIKLEDVTRSTVLAKVMLKSETI